MSVWDLYESRADVKGRTRRDAILKRELYMLEKKSKDSLSYHTATIDGIDDDVCVINSDNLNEKTFISLNGTIKCGSYISWMDNIWLVTEFDANNEIYTKAKAVQCNYNLKWVSADGNIHSQWCIIEDGTKYLTGEYEDRKFIVTRGDSRIAMTIGRNSLTAKFNRESRFIIDDPLSEDKLSYLLTKPLKVGHVYGDNGVYSFVLQEVVSTDDDNMEESIADYYKYFPKSEDSEGSTENQETSLEETNTTGKTGWF